MLGMFVSASLFIFNESPATVRCLCLARKREKPKMTATGNATAVKIEWPWYRCQSEESALGFGFRNRMLKIRIAKKDNQQSKCNEISCFEETNVFTFSVFVICQSSPTKNAFSQRVTHWWRMKNPNGAAGGFQRVLFARSRPFSPSQCCKFDLRCHEIVTNQLQNHRMAEKNLRKNEDSGQ